MIKFSEKKYLSVVQETIDKKSKQQVIHEVVGFVKRNLPEDTINEMIAHYDKKLDNHLLAIACAYEDLACQLLAYYKAIVKRLTADRKEGVNSNKNVN